MQSDMVHVGKEGWLYLVGGSNNVIDNYVNPGTFSSYHVTEWIKLLMRRLERAQSVGSRYVHLIAPEKLSAYPEFFDGELPYLSQSPANRFPSDCAAAGIGELVVDALPTLNRYKPNFKLYWQTDTHWTPYGCFCAYQAVCERLGISADRRFLDEVGPPNEILLDLGSKLDSPRREPFAMLRPLKNARRVAANSIVVYKERHGLTNDAALHRGSNVVFVNDSPSAHPARVVLFGDSFAEYRPHLLTGMLAETVKELHFVWSLGIDWDYVYRFEPDIIITEATERFMNVVPVDNFDLDHFAITTLAPLSWTVGFSDS